MRELIEARISELKRKTYGELSQLPEYEGQKIKHGSKTVTVAVWKEILTAHELRVVVQVYRHLFLGIGTMDARGFRIDDKGSVTELAKDEIYEFI